MAIFSGCNSHNSEKRSHYNARFEQMRREATTAGAFKDFAKSDSIGRALFHEAEKEGNDVYMAYGLLCQSFYTYTSEGTDKRMAKVKQAEKIARETGNDSLLSRIYNVLGSFSVGYTHNFNDAKDYFTEAIRYARQAGAPDFEIAAECNLSEIYRDMGDTLGIKYDLDIYRYALKSGNADLLHSAAHHCAEYYLKSETDYGKAMVYTEKLKEIGQVYLYHLLRGDYYMRCDSLDKAREEYLLSLKYGGHSPAAFENYGILLNRLGKHAESNEMLKKAIDIYSQMDIYNSKQIKIYDFMADNYNHMGQYDLAYSNLKKYFAGRDSIEEIRKREDIQRYKVKFDVEKKELELAHEKSDNRMKNIIIAGICIVFLLTVGAFTFYTQRRNRLHRIIVAQQIDHLNSATYTSPAGPDYSPAESSSTVPLPGDEMQRAALPQEQSSAKGLSDEKAESIWRNILNEIKENRVFADPQITRDSFADRVGCNHTWFTQAIKMKTGKSYTQFMNACRVEESVRLLSDPACALTQKEVAAKVGFLSPSSFYSTFRQQIGMSPAEFRQQAIKIERTERTSGES